MGPVAALRAAAPLVLGSVAVLWLSLQVLHLAGRPLATDDLWFHLKLGQIYASEGLALDHEPLLHTVDVPPSPHAWLFQVGVAGVQSVFGFQGLRVLHGVAVAAILALVLGLFLRGTRWAPAAVAGLALFLALAWYRLFQLRPDLVSIPAAFALYGLVLQGRAPPGRVAVAGSALVLLVWVNAHSLFALGLAFLATGVLGLAIRHALLGLVEDADRRALRARNAVALRRVAAALGVGGLATLANPRGMAAHATFFASSAAQGIWAIGDDWRPFDPLHFEYRGDSLSRLSWGLVDALAVAFVVASVAWALALWRRRRASDLERCDPVLFGLALASFLAILGSVRFLWLAFFPVLFLLRGALRPWAGAPRPTPLAAWAAAAACVALAVAVPSAGGLARWRARVPAAPSAYLAQAVNHGKYFGEGVRFLREAGLEGRLFNVYSLGGYLGYWVTPALRTFVDGRTRPDLLRDLVAVLRQAGALPGEGFLDVLDRRGVDVFFGVGVPSGAAGRVGREYSVPLLEGAAPERWILAGRGLRYAVYLRAGPGSAANRERVAAYYAAAEVAFDPERGLDVGRVIDEHPAFAVQHGMAPPDIEGLRGASRDGSPDGRFVALERLAITWGLLGLTDRQIEAEQQAIALRPQARAPRRRLVLALLRRDRVADAAEAMGALQALGSGDPRTAALVSVSRRYLRLREARDDAGRGREPQAVLNRVAWLTPQELARYNRRR